MFYNYLKLNIFTAKLVWDGQLRPWTMQRRVKLVPAPKQKHGDAHELQCFLSMNLTFTKPIKI